MSVRKKVRSTAAATSSITVSGVERFLFCMQRGRSGGAVSASLPAGCYGDPDSYWDAAGMRCGIVRHDG